MADQSIEVLYYDGQFNKAHQAQLYTHPHGVVVQYLDQEKFYVVHDLKYIAPVGKIMPALELPDDARIEFLTQDVPTWLDLPNRKTSDFFHKVERSWRWIALSFVMMLVILFATYQWGIPYAAHQIAQYLPQKTLNKIGNQAEQFIVDYTQPSELSSQQKDHIQQLYQSYLGQKLPVKLIFRKGGEKLSANALAIPNGTIILTDELVKLVKNDQELLSVLAHEQGHLVEKHSLQQALRSMGLTILYVSITGDASDVVSGLPLAIAVSQYSQEFELQADQYAIDQLKLHNISPQYLADFLARLTKESGNDPEASDFLESHPSTAKRVAQIQAQK